MKNLKLFNLKLKQKLINIKRFIYKNVYKVKSSYELFKEFMITKTKQDYLKWQLKDDKSLLTILVESSLNALFKYLSFGLLITFTLHTFFNLPFKVNWIISYGITYWLLENVVLLLKTKTK